MSVTYCPHCGHKLDPDEDSIYCEECGGDILRDPPGGAVKPLDEDED